MAQSVWTIWEMKKVKYNKSILQICRMIDWLRFHGTFSTIRKEGRKEVDMYIAYRQ